MSNRKKKWQYLKKQKMKKNQGLTNVLFDSRVVTSKRILADNFASFYTNIPKEIRKNIYDNDDISMKVLEKR